MCGEVASETFFSDMQRLRHLQINFQGHGGLEKCEPQHLMNSVMMSVGNTLEALSFTVNYDIFLGHFSAPIRSLSQLTQLRDLDIDCGLFYAWKDMDEEPVSGDDHRVGLLSLVCSNQSPCDVNDHCPSSCPSILELLPNSLSTLERISLHVSPRYADIACLKRLLHSLNGFGDDNEHLGMVEDAPCPNLQELRVYMYRWDDGDENYFGNRPARIEQKIEHVQSYLADRVPGCMVKVLSGRQYWTFQSERTVEGAELTEQDRIEQERSERLRLELLNSLRFGTR